MQISSISGLTTTELKSLSQTASTAASSSSTGTSSSKDSVGETFNQILNSLNESQNNADTLLSQLASGEDVDVSELMIATTENDVNFRVAMAIRDKLVEAYRQINQMNV
jgi:flagellar hook-basal body complex protein FliE